MFPFDNSYARLPDRFYARIAPTTVSAPKTIKFNTTLAQQLSLDTDILERPDAAEIFAGNRVPDRAEPIATAYAGHQFGRFVPQLGDGRAILLGEVIGRDGIRYDIQLKGSGQTPYSRNGDGRAALGPVLREYLISEAMAGFGIPTTRALAAVATGDRVFRDRILPGAILVRVAKGLIRVGTFEYFAARRDIDALQTLAEYAINRHYPEVREATNPYRAFLDAVIEAQAKLIARWMHVGFIHGVMNTDNMAISGETIDFGPCAFMDTFHPQTVYSSIDRNGRYAYQNQPAIAQWNLTQLAQCLLPLLADNDESAVREAQDAIDAFPRIYFTAWHDGMRKKLGLSTARDGDRDLANELLAIMANEELDYTNTFRGLSKLLDPQATPNGLHAELTPTEEQNTWVAKWRQRLATENVSIAEHTEMMNSANPAHIPRNHRVEKALEAALRGDMIPFERLLEVVSHPYRERPEFQSYTIPPRSDEIVQATFCGT